MYKNYSNININMIVQILLLLHFHGIFYCFLLYFSFVHEEVNQLLLFLVYYFVFFRFFCYRNISNTIVNWYFSQYHLISRKSLIIQIQNSRYKINTYHFCQVNYIWTIICTKTIIFFEFDIQNINNIHFVL